MSLLFPKFTSLNHYYTLPMIKGQTRPISFARGNSMLSSTDSVLRELSSSLNWGTSVCCENSFFLMPFRALSCKWLITKDPATEFLHRKHSALARQGPERKQLKKFLNYPGNVYIFMSGAGSGTLAELLAAKAVTFGAIQYRHTNVSTDRN